MHDLNNMNSLFNAFLFLCQKIQRVVISGGNFKPDTLKPKEVVSLLLDDDELEKKCECFDLIALSQTNNWSNET